MTQKQSKNFSVLNNINKEVQRQENTLNFIASENIIPKNILKASGSILMNKYAEGYPFKRYYSGNKFIDKIEDIAIKRAKSVFKADHANLQPHSGSSANMATYFALTNWLKKGKKILSMGLDQGGHLSHGSKVSFSGKLFQVDFYNLDKKTYRIDYNKVEEKAKQFKPDILVSGASAYPREIDFKKFQKIADNVGAYHVADIAHIAGLVAAGFHQNPVALVDVVTGTTQKTLKGPRGGFILCKDKHKKKINKAVFPGIQGGPLENIIAGKAICFKNAKSKSFKKYQKQVIQNAKVLAKTLINNGLDVLTNGTDNHLVIVDLSNLGLAGKKAEDILEKSFITVNKNMIPYDKKSPQNPSGIRFGTPYVTSQGLKEKQIKKIANIISLLLKEKGKESIQKRAKNLVLSICKEFPIY